MTAPSTLNAGREQCRTPLDARYFDESDVPVVIKAAGLMPLARFELPFGYCGSLDAFWQFTDAHARNNAEIVTPDLEWLLLINGQPVSPYLALKTIIQPWGWPVLPISIRLPVNAVVEFTARVVNAPPDPNPNPITVAGRIFGRYWYSEE